MQRRTILYAIVCACFLALVGWVTVSARTHFLHEPTGIPLNLDRVSAGNLSLTSRSIQHDSAPDAYTWAVAGSPVSYTLTSVDMLSATDGWAVGYWDRYTNGDPRGETILRWDGIEWYEWYSWSEDPPLFSVEMNAPDDGWTVGGVYGSKFSRWDGNDWNSFAVPNYGRINASTMVSDTDGWAVGGSGSCVPSGIHGTILRWNGYEWGEWLTSIPDRVLYDVDMISASVGWAVGYYCYWSGSPPASYNSVIMRWNGTSWSYSSGPTYQTLYSVDLISATDGWAVGDRGVTLHWNGSAWSEVSSPTECTLRSVSVISTNDVWAVGGGGTSCASLTTPVILHWNGSAWSEIPSPITQVLNSVNMISSEEGWAVGEAGTILHYTSLDKLVRVATVATADDEWNWKSEFNPGDPIRYINVIVNETGSDAQIALTYEARGPHNESVFDDQFSDTIPPGVWQWGDDWIIPEGMGGIHTFTGSGLYMGTTSQYSTPYTVTGTTNYKIYLPLTRK
jgi:hypothetical protein